MVLSRKRPFACIMDVFKLLTRAVFPATPFTTHFRQCSPSPQPPSGFRRISSHLSSTNHSISVVLLHHSLFQTHTHTHTLFHDEFWTWHFVFRSSASRPISTSGFRSFSDPQNGIPRNTLSTATTSSTLQSAFIYLFIFLSRRVSRLTTWLAANPNHPE